MCKLIQSDQGIDRLGSGIANLLVGQAQTAKIIQVKKKYLILKKENGLKLKLYTYFKDKQFLECNYESF